MRFQASLNVNLNEFLTNLIPYSRIHYPVSFFAPLTSSRRRFKEKLGVIPITTSVFLPRTQMIDCDMRYGKYMGCCLPYRGEVTGNEVYQAIEAIKKKHTIYFVDWVPTGFKVGIACQPTTTVPRGNLARVERTMCLLANTISIAEAWGRLSLKFDLMYSKHEFVHWFVAEGVGESEFPEAREFLSTLEMDYLEVGLDTVAKVVSDNGVSAEGVLRSD